MYLFVIEKFFLEFCRYYRDFCFFYYKFLDVDIFGGDRILNYEDLLLLLWFVGFVVKVGENIDFFLIRKVGDFIVIICYVV